VAEKCAVSGAPLLIVILILSSIQGCTERDDLTGIDPREEMREFVMNISGYARNLDPYFIVITQNGNELLTDENGTPRKDYIEALDGVGQEDLFYGYLKDDSPTPPEENSYLLSLLDDARENGLKVLVTDYCSTRENMDDSYSKNEQRGFISFAAERRDLDIIPSYPKAPHRGNSENVSELSEARNFLYLLDPSSFSDRDDYLDALEGTDHDLLIIDAFFDGAPLSRSDVDRLRTRSSGGSRLVISYLSIGEAEDYRYFWDTDWEKDPPPWLDDENPDWGGNYKVRYWDGDWKDIIYGSGDSYLDRIIYAGFDGVYLDIIDAFEYYE